MDGTVALAGAVRVVTMILIGFKLLLYLHMPLNDFVLLSFAPERLQSKVIPAYSKCKEALQNRPSAHFCVFHHVIYS